MSKKDWTKWVDNNCGGSGPCEGHEVRKLPTGGDSNAILCKACWRHEMRWRKVMREAGRDFPFVEWDKLDTYSHEEKFHMGIGLMPLCPALETWEDCFCDEVYCPGSGERFRRSKITDFICLGPGRSLRAKPKPVIIEVIKLTMLSIEYDAISFKLYVGDERATVFAEYSKIIGSRYLAEIDATTIPSEAADPGGAQGE